jgi:hypothetical protein
MFTISLFSITNVLAKTNDLSINEITISDKSETVSGNIISNDDSSINTDITFHQLDDYVIYKIVIKNNNKDLKIKTISDNNSNEYIEYIYDKHENEVLKKGDTLELEVKAIYSNELTDITKREQSANLVLKIDYEQDKEVKSANISINPNTNDGIKGSIILVVISSLGIVVGILLYKKNKKIVKVSLVLLTGTLMLPVIVKAITYSVSLNLNNNYKIYDKLIVTYNVDGEEDSIIVPYNTVAGLNTPANGDEIFESWLLDDESKFDISNPIVEDVNIYASWKDRSLYNVLKRAALDESFAREYTDEHFDSIDTSLSTEKIYYVYNSSFSGDASEVLNNINLIFGGYCWKMIRTTDTGGVKLLYNGVPENGTCSEGRTVTVGNIKYNNSSNSVAYAGYMYGDVYVNTKKTFNTSDRIGSSVTWDGEKYTLHDVVNCSVVNEFSNLNNHHYYCVNNNNDTCTEVAYVYTYNPYWSGYYITLKNGMIDPQDALDAMLKKNTNNSNMKTYLENWYANNMLEYDDYIEDVVYCNDRSISDIAGWTVNNELKNNYIFFKGSPGLSCTNETDRFSTLNNKAKTNYKVGLLTSKELYLLYNINIRPAETDYWLMNPSYMYLTTMRMYGAYNTGAVNTLGLDNANVTHGVRPSISLKPGTLFKSGDGSMENPYIIN